MSPPLIALAAFACYLAGWRGLLLVRSESEIAQRFAAFDELEEAEARPSLLDRAVQALTTRLAGPLMDVLGERRLEKMERRLRLAGFPDGLTPRTYVGRKAAWTLLLGVPGLVMIANGNVPVGLIGILLGWFLVDLGVVREARQRQATIARELPDFLDIVAVTISSGSSFRASMRRVADEMPGPLSAEILMSLRQIDLGSSRRDALEALRARNDVDTLDTFVTSLLQSEELGAPLSQTLTDLARDMRVERGQRLRKKAAEAAPKVSLVVILLLVPATLVITVAAMFIGSEIDLGILTDTELP